MNDLNLDSVNFDPRRYISNFLKTNTIKDLIKKNNEIQQQIKQHDHQIQSLVFQNYSKFISSIDTVKQMKTDISKVDDKLKKLDDSMDKISELALKIDNTFSVKRKEIQKLDTINKDLQKLKNLCEFPEVLKSDLQYYRSLEKSQEKPYQQLFERSVAYYKQCFSTLNEFKTQPLISPIFKQSINKVQQMRSILWSLQSQLKSRSNSKDLKSITKKFLTVTQEQISPLRTYFKKAKEKLSDGCLANEKYWQFEEFVEGEVDAEVVRGLDEERLQGGREKEVLNEGYWVEFEQDFVFVKEDLMPILKHTEDIDQLIVNSCREAFSFVLGNFCDSVQKHCQSPLHLSLLLQKAHSHFLNVISCTFSQPLKRQFQKTLTQKLQTLCTNHISTVFTRYKLSILLQFLKQKESLLEMKPSQDTQKEVYGRINPLKAFISGNFLRVVVGLRRINEREYFTQRRYMDLLITQLGELARFLAYVLSTPSSKVSEEVYGIFGVGRLLATQRKGVEEAVLRFRMMADCGLQYLYNHNVLQILAKTLWGRLLADFSAVFGEEPKDTASELFKKSINKNLCNLSFHYVVLVQQVYSQPQSQPLYFQSASHIVQDLVQISSYIFPQSRRNIPKKPSLLNTSTDRSSYSYQTQVMLVKKAHMFDKRDSFTRSTLLSTFTKGVLKGWLRAIRLNLFSSSKFESEVYCLVQLCYEMASVDEESLISAYFYLLRGQYYRSENVKVDKGVLDAVYSGQRAKTKI